MAAASSYNGRDGPPSRCAECNGVLVDALVLSCGHDLCLSCASIALRNTSSLKGRTVACGVCRERTQLCEEAAATLAVQPAQASSEVVFNLLDRNHDGSISRSEWKQAMHGLGLRGGSQASQASQFAATPAWGSSSTTSQQQQPVFQAGLQVPKLLQPYMDGFSAAPSEADGMAPSTTPRRGLSDYSLGDSAPSRPRVATIPTSSTSAGTTPTGTVGLSPSPAALPSLESQQFSGRLAHIPRCPDHPEEQATYFCATCECFCICAECVVQKNGRHHDHEVLRVGHAHEKLRAGAGALLDEAVALEDEFEKVADGLMWQRKDVERAASRGRATIRCAFERARAQLNDREAKLMESLDLYESESLGKLDSGFTEHATRLEELRRLQENLRTRCRNGGDAVEALNTYASAKRAIATLSMAFRKEDPGLAEPPDEFAALVGTARAELDRHADGLASLEETVQSLCRRGVDLPSEALHRDDRRTDRADSASSIGKRPVQLGSVRGDGLWSDRLMSNGHNGGYMPHGGGTGSVRSDGRITPGRTRAGSEVA